MSAGKDRVAFLDALRFAAAAAVLLQHALELGGEWSRWVTSILSPGVFGVVLFFLVSGFVIPLSVREPFHLGTFASRRLFRIMPLALFTFGLVAVVRWANILPGFGPAVDLTPRDWIANILLVQDYVGATPVWGVTWTLSVEIAWYVLFAASSLLLGKTSDAILAIVMPLVLMSLALGSLLAGHRVPLAHIGMIYAAVLGARAYRAFIGELSRAALLLDTAIFATTMSVCNVVAFGYFSHPAITLNQALYPWLAAPALFVTVAMVPAVRTSRLFCNAFVQTAGTISYSIYLLHPLAIAIAIASLPRGLVLPGAAALTLLLAVAGYYLVERPGQRFGRFVISRCRSVRIAAA